VSCDHGGIGLEGLGGADESGVALVHGAVEAVVGGGLLGHVPDAFDAIQLGGVGGPSKQLDLMPMRGEPLLSILLEAPARKAGSAASDSSHSNPWGSEKYLEGQIRWRWPCVWLLLGR
jgi:hypothetical protein